MPELRIVLIAVGVLIVGAVVGWGILRRRRAAGLRPRGPLVSPLGNRSDAQVEGQVGNGTAQDVGQSRLTLGNILDRLSSPRQTMSSERHHLEPPLGALTPTDAPDQLPDQSPDQLPDRPAGVSQAEPTVGVTILAAISRAQDRAIDVGDLSKLTYTANARASCADTHGCADTSDICAVSSEREERNSVDGPPPVAGLNASIDATSDTGPTDAPDLQDKANSDREPALGQLPVEGGERSAEGPERLTPGAAQTDDPRLSAPRNRQDEPLIIALTLFAPRNAPYRGEVLHRAFARCRLEHGSMGLFHRHVASGDDGGLPVFSVANLVEPGSFSVTQMDDIVTPGICVFMQLPGPIDGIQGFEMMLALADSLRDELGGELRDENRSTLTGQGTARMREQVVEHAMRSRRNIGSNGVLG
jgi:cell division protein ZipA